MPPPPFPPSMHSKQSAKPVASTLRSRLNNVCCTNSSILIVWNTCIYKKRNKLR